MSQFGCQQTSFLSINLKLKSCSLVFLNSFSKFMILFCLCPPISPKRSQSPHIILALFLTHHSLSQNISHPCLNHAFYPIVTFAEFGTLSTNYSTAKTIAMSLIHSKVDYCNSLFLNFPRRQHERLQLIFNSTARAISKTPHFIHISPILKALHWLKIDQRIQYKLSLSFSPTKHFNLKNIPYISTFFLTFKLTLLLAHLLLSLFSVRQSILVSK